MHFVSYQQLQHDVRGWSNQLPGDIAAIAGIPRSGLLVAVHLALHRNCHLVSVEDVLRQNQSWETPLRRGKRKASGRRLLIVDDSINRGDTLTALKRQLAGLDVGLEIEFGALYYRSQVRHLVEHAFRHLPQPRCFEWNVFHCERMRRSCVDLDGVLCEDFPIREEDDGPHLRRWLDHLESAPPKYLPTFPVLAIVTSRLEKYRPETEAWLHKHGVRYHQLVMSPHATAAARRKSRDHARRKAEFYRRQGHAQLFIESSPEQARAIASLAGKPVLCVKTMSLIG